MTVLLSWEEKTHIQSTGGVVAPHIAANRSNRKRQADLEVKRQMEYMRLHPLPLRMPKYAEVLSRRGALNKIAFVDDIWDGFVIDAFAKITQLDHEHDSMRAIRFLRGGRKLSDDVDFRVATHIGVRDDLARLT